MRRFIRLAVVFGWALTCYGYSVLTHQAVTDSVWESHIKPLLLKRFPQATPDELLLARSYVYGGSLIQDIGYVPMGSRNFSDLTHYVSSGEFVTEMLRQAATLDEYAFALGGLAHYVSDKSGHPFINRITPLLYPKARAKFGNEVTYEDDPVAHLKAEFSLDVLQAARGLYAPDAFHSFIGFRVSNSVMKRAFESTYGFPMKDIFLSEDIAIGTYRFSVSRILPMMTNVAWELRRHEIAKRKPRITRRQFLYVLPRRQFEKEWGKEYRKPGRGARTIAWIFRVVPAVGPFKPLRFPHISTEAEDLFLRGLERTVADYRVMLDQEMSGTLRLEAENLDTGTPSKPGTYRLADKAYDALLARLAKKRFEGIPSALRRNILQFYQGRELTQEQAETRKALDDLRTVMALEAGAR